MMADVGRKGGMSAVDLLPHNKAAYDAVVEHLKHSDRTCVIHPTGTGKSFIALQYIEDHPDERGLYVTSVATNLLEFWDKVEKLGSYRMVLNLSDVARHVGTGKRGDLDGVAEDDEETIDDEERADLLKRATEIDESHLAGPVIQFCLYAGLEHLLPNFDYIIIDEFHRAGARQWESRVKHLLEENKGAKVIGFSATPTRMDGRDMRELFNNDVASEMHLSDAIANRLLPLPVYWVGMIEFDPESPVLDEDGTLATEKKKQNYTRIAKRHLEAGTGLREAFQEALTAEHAERGKFIIFCRTIQNIRTLKRMSDDWFGWADEVHRYEMHVQDRDGFSDFAKDEDDCLRVLFVVDMLTEGVHMDDLDGVIMLRPTESERIFFQQLGRALAVSTKREHPLIFDIASNAAAMRGGMDFIKGVGKKMELEDKEMEKFFHITTEAADFIEHLRESEFDYDDALRAFYEENGHLYIPAGYKVGERDVYEYYCKIKGRKNQLSDWSKKHYEAMGMDWDITSRWMKGYNAAAHFHDQHGNLDVPSTIGKYDDIWLYDWCNQNRTSREKLCERQIGMLDALGFDWTIHDRWEDNFAELERFKAEHGHTDVPNTHPLARFVAGLRKNPLDEEKRKRLEEIGFEWDGRAARSRNAWRAGKTHAQEYYEKNGNLKVPGGFICSDGYKLGNFVKRVKKDGRLEELMAAIG